MLRLRCRVLMPSSAISPRPPQRARLRPSSCRIWRFWMILTSSLEFLPVLTFVVPGGLV
jgi:hypothetical protein